MGEIRPDEVVSDGYRGPDRRRPGLLGKIERTTIRMVRSKWVAAFITALAVSWCFHIVEEKSDKKIERVQAIQECTITKVASTQADKGRRVAVTPILEACKKQAGK